MAINIVFENHLAVQSDFVKFDFQKICMRLLYCTGVGLKVLRLKLIRHY